MCKKLLSFQLAIASYFIVLYGCVCHPLINGYDDDDDLHI